jgi:hypothetical protein
VVFNHIDEPALANLAKIPAKFPDIREFGDVKANAPGVRGGDPH